MDKLPVATGQMPLKGFTVTDKLSVTRFVHGICAQDAAGRVETRETPQTRHERPPSVR